MPPKASTTTKVAVAPRLPPLPKMRVRRPNKADANPCVGIMSSVLGTFVDFSFLLSFLRRVGGMEKAGSE